MTANSPRNLVIVESPSKAKTIEKYLGKDYKVCASYGHIRDLISEKKSKTNIYGQLGLRPDKNWEASYGIIPRAEKVVRDLKKYIKEAEHIILATDPDREGEAIAWHLKEILPKSKSCKRVVFNEITKEVVTKAFNNPRDIDIDLVNAQQARRFLDRVFGFLISPVLWKKVSPRLGLSAGRVQSPALSLVVARDMEINAFIPQEYWRFSAHTSLSGAQPCKATTILADQLKFNSSEEDDTTKDDKKPLWDEGCFPIEIKIKDEVTSQAEAQGHIQAVANHGQAVVVDIKRTLQKSRPTPPFITSTLQRSASTLLGFRLTRTMRAAQQLYENAHITYMRTDSTSVGAQAIDMVREHIGQSFSEKYLPAKSIGYKTSKASAQEGHEAIRPTTLATDPRAVLASLGEDAGKLYNLIRDKFISSQMPASEHENLQVTFKIGDYEGVAKGTRVVFDGFTKVWKYNRRKEVTLPELTKGQSLALANSIGEQLFTRPKPHFTEATLVKVLEELEIGRPSTYANIVSTLIERKYVTLNVKQLKTTTLGFVVADNLKTNFQQFIALEFTKQMEGDLDKISQGHFDWHGLLDDFYSRLTTEIDKVVNDVPDIHTEPAVIDNIKCEVCSSAMTVYFTADRQFLGCSNYNECKDLRKLPENTGKKSVLDLYVYDENETLQPFAATGQEKVCPTCQGAMMTFFTSGYRVQRCANVSGCKTALATSINWSAPEVAEITFPCDTPKCGGDLVAKKGRYGAFFRCESCETTRKANKQGLPNPRVMTPIPTDISCEKNKTDHYVLREGVNGLFLAASKYPKVRESRSPKIAEVLPMLSQMEKRFDDLVSKAPQVNEKGEPFVISKNRSGTYVLKTAGAKKPAMTWEPDVAVWTIAKK